MVKLFFNTIAILGRRETNILSAASVIMTSVIFSRVLGLVRDRLLTARFPSEELGVYFAAFRIPNMIFELLVMGSFAAAFIPVFTSYMDDKGKEEAFAIASSVISVGLLLFGLISIPLVVFAPTISRLLAPGFSEQQIVLMASFTRIMILAQVFPLIIGNFLTSILQSFRNFLLPSLAPIVYNVGIILSIIMFSPSMGLYAPVFGVVLGAILFAGIQIPAVIGFGYAYRWNVELNHPGTREIGRLMLPRTLGLAVSQIDTTVDLVLSTLLGASSVTVFNLAQHLQQVPIGLFGASIAQATLPSLSSFYTQKNTVEFKKIFLSSAHQILFFTVPISAVLIVLRIPVVRLVFGASTRFDWDSTVLTGMTLTFFSISLFAQSLVHLLARSFYALHDTKTPVFVGIGCVALNAFLSTLFVMYYHMPVWSLALSASIASILNMLFLLYYIEKKIGNFTRAEFYMPAIKIILSGIVTGVAMYIPKELLDQLVFDTTRTINLILLTVVCTATGASVYIFLAWFLEIPQVMVVGKLFKRAKSLKKGVYIDTSQEVG